MKIFDHTIFYWIKYLLIIMILGVTYDQLEKVLLKDG